MRTLIVTIISMFYAVCSIAQDTVIISTKFPFSLEILQGFSFDLNKNDTIMPVYNEGKFHYINSYTGIKIADVVFDEAYPFKDNYAIVKQNGKYGIIDKNINYLIKPTFDVPEIFTSREHIWNDNWNINKYFSFTKGTFVTDTSAFRFDEPIGPQIWFAKKGKKYYYELNDRSKTQSAPIYDTFYVVNPYFAIASRSGRFGAINSKGKVAIPFIYKKYIGPKGFSNVDYYVFKKGGKWHYYSGNRVLFKTHIKPCFLYKDVLIYKSGKLYNYLNYLGVKTLPNNYKWIYRSGNLAINNKNELVLFNSKKQALIYYQPIQN